MEFDALQELRAAGVIKPNTNSTVTQVLSGLEKHEVEFLKSLNAKVAAAQPEVVAHGEGDEEDTPCLFGMSIVR